VDEQAFDDATVIMDTLIVIRSNTETIIELLQESDEDDEDDG